MATTNFKKESASAKAACVKIKHLWQTDTIGFRMAGMKEAGCSSVFSPMDILAFQMLKKRTLFNP